MAALWIFSACGGPQVSSELAYLLDHAGKSPKQEGVLRTSPLNERLQGLLQDRYNTFFKNWDAEPPLRPAGDAVFAWGCVSHYCNEYGSAFHVDLVKDELIAVMRVKYNVEVFREKEGGLDDLPTAVTDWIGDAEEVTVGVTGLNETLPESTGAFAWRNWADAPADWKKGLKRIKANKKMSVFEQAEQAAGLPCDVRIARYDLDGDGQPGTILTYSCQFWCGQVGCAFKVYEGGKQINLVDIINEVMPGDGGVITSKGVLMKLK